VIGFALSPRLVHMAERAFRHCWRATSPNGELRRRLTPVQVIGCKRVLRSEDYYQPVRRPNLQFVTDAIPHRDCVSYSPEE